jgi:serine kinase of HPr protein (carbohydrate metabolism regulator)
VTTPANLHATAIVVGTRGLLFTGPSGAGKSMMAFNCLAMAGRHGVFSALIADDQVFVSGSGGRVIATCPPAIAGMMELRGSGIVRMENVESATLDLVIRVVSLADADRLPPEHERFPIAGEELPLVRIANTASDPLAVIGALIPSWRSERPFWHI